MQELQWQQRRLQLLRGEERIFIALCNGEVEHEFALCHFGLVFEVNGYCLCTTVFVRNNGIIAANFFALE